MDERVPTICTNRTTWTAHSLFNSNEWRVESKPVVRSCAAQFGLLLHTAGCAPNEVTNGRRACEASLENLRIQWRLGQWDLSRGLYLVEAPTVHLHIQAFLSTGKTLLDLLAQLVSTEGLVTTKVHGFHKKGSVIGGDMLHTLNNKAISGRESQATDLHTFLEREKILWIDNLVRARDYMAHPRRGMHQVLWELQLAESEGGLQANCIIPPHIASLPFDKYIEVTAAQIESAMTAYLRLVRSA